MYQRTPYNPAAHPHSNSARTEQNAITDVTPSDSAARTDLPIAAHVETSRNVYSLFKSVFEYVVAIFLLIVSAPVIALVALVVKLTSPGPVLFSQARVGKHGRVFKVHKIRTMVHNCEEVSGPRWSTPGDPRVTPVGRFLRASHLDELPQLWNVLAGQMSLVGPRPERPEFVPTLEKAIPHYLLRLTVRPGVTGLAQVQLPADTDLSSVRRKLAYDLYYIRHLSFWLDLRLMLCTAIRMFKLPFHVLTYLFVLPRLKVVEDYYHTRNLTPSHDALEARRPCDAASARRSEPRSLQKTDC